MREAALRQIVVEKLYMTPQRQHQIDMHKIASNPSHSTLLLCRIVLSTYIPLTTTTDPTMSNVGDAVEIAELNQMAPVHGQLGEDVHDCGKQNGSAAIEATGVAGPKDRMLACGFCGNAFRAVSALKYPVALPHTCRLVWLNRVCRRHEDRHTKPYVCNIQDCHRRNGFGSHQDLARHQKSVHQMLGTGGDGTKWYLCAAPGCELASKWWSRKDNFKEHVKRRHGVAGQEMIDLTVSLYEFALHCYDH